MLPWLVTTAFVWGLRVATWVAVAAAIVLAVRAWRAADRTDRGLAIGVFVGALALRLAAPAMPFDIHLRSWEVFLGVVPYPWTYGVGFAAFWSALGLGFTSMPVLFDAGAVAGALGCVALGGWLRRADLHPAGAWGAAGIAAAWGPLVGFGHTDVQALPEILCFLLALLLWTADDGPRWGLAGAAALAVASAQRPEAAILPVFAALALWGAGRPVPWRWWGGAFAVAVAHLAAIVLLKPPMDLQGVGIGGGLPSPFVHGPTHWAGWSPLWTSWAVIALTLVGLAAAPGRRRLAWLALPLGLGALVWTASWAPVDPVMPIFVRHQLRSLPWFAALAGWGIAAVAGRQPAVAWVIAAVAVTAQLTTLPPWFQPRRQSGEWAVAYDGLDDVPDGCLVVSWTPRTDYGLAPPQILPRLRDRDVRWFDAAQPLPDPLPACVVWYRSGDCELVVAALGLSEPAPCDAWEAGWDLEPLHIEEVSATPWLYARHRRDTVRVGYARLRDPEAIRAVQADSPARGSEPSR